jgi:hypothetical protein
MTFCCGVANIGVIGPYFFEDKWRFNEIYVKENGIQCLFIL